jgi:hypothetical protein
VPQIINNNRLAADQKADFKAFINRSAREQEKFFFLFLYKIIVSLNPAALDRHAAPPGAGHFASGKNRCLMIVPRLRKTACQLQK